MVFNYQIIDYPKLMRNDDIICANEEGKIFKQVRIAVVEPGLKFPQP